MRKVIICLKQRTYYFQIPPEISSSGMYLLIRFKTDDTINWKGFSGAYVLRSSAAPPHAVSSRQGVPHLSRGAVGGIGGGTTGGRRMYDRGGYKYKLKKQREGTAKVRHHPRM